MPGMKWIALESNPEVMNFWANKVGLDPSDSQFCDVYGLDQELLAMVPQTVKAIVLLFPWPGPWKESLIKEDEKIKTEGQPPIDPNVVWIKQTIGNACGTMAVIHALANCGATLKPDSPFAEFTARCKGVSGEERIRLLEANTAFAEAHAQAAVAGQSVNPGLEHPPHAYTAFVQAPAVSTGDGENHGKRLIELNGGRDGPIDRGASSDLLQDVVTYVKENLLPLGESVEYSMIALAAAQ